MLRRRFLMVSAGLGLAAGSGAARAHHGWGSFDATQPIYLEGRAARVAWRNPHAELDLEVASPLEVPADLAQRPLPAQSAQVDTRELLAKLRPPRRQDKLWHIELAPLSRMQAWKVQEIRPGDRVALIGYTLPEEKGEAVLRAEYLFAGGGIYGLRSSPV